MSISRFWRDRDFWESLQAFWLPALQQRFGGQLAAWSAGCACGEEAYSLAMAHREGRVADRAANGPLLVVMATDLNPVVLTRARAGIAFWRRSPFGFIPAACSPSGGGSRCPSACPD